MLLYEWIIIIIVTLNLVNSLLLLATNKELKKMIIRVHKLESSLDEYKYKFIKLLSEVYHSKFEETEIIEPKKSKKKGKK